MIHSGLDAFPHAQEKDIRKAMEVFQKHDSLFMFHAEVDCGGHPHNTVFLFCFSFTTDQRTF